MKKRVLYPIMALALVLGLALSLATPVMASEIAGTKATDPVAPNIYYVGDTIDYVMTVNNPAGNPSTNTLTRIWDVLPDGTVIEFLGSGETLVQAPGDEATFTASYTVDEDDIEWSGTFGYWLVRNEFRAEGTDSEDDNVFLLVTRNSRVIRPDTEVTIVASETTVSSGQLIDLAITEANTGYDPLTDVYVEVRENGTLLYTLDENTPGWSSDGDADDVLDVGETWSWTIEDVEITATTTFVAYGFGTDPLDNEVSHPEYPDERDEVTISIRGEACLVICKFHDSNADGVWDYDEPGLGDWRFRVQGPGGYETWVTTEPEGCVLLDTIGPGTYTITEEMQPGWYNTRPGGTPPYSQTVQVAAGVECTRVEFGNSERKPDNPGVPALSQWSTLVMMVMFGALLAWALRRKRLLSRTS